MYSDSIPSTRSLIRSSDDRVHGCHSPTHSASLLYEMIDWRQGWPGRIIGIICMMHLLLVFVFAAFICCILFGYLCLTCIQDSYTTRTVWPYTQDLVSTAFSCLLQMHFYLSYQETVRMISVRCCFPTLYINCTCWVLDSPRLHCCYFRLMLSGGSSSR